MHIPLPPAVRSQCGHGVFADELRDAARLARDCPVMGQAVALARWIGTGHRPVTAGQVLRKADVSAAGDALGVDVPPKLRTMADLDERLAQVRATGHPDADTLARAVAQFAASGAPLSIDQVARLKVPLTDFRPPIWRRVRLPLTATLADLHGVIQVLFGWDGDHLHLFQVGKKQYSDPFMHLEETGYDDEVRVRDVTSAGGKITYIYDLGTEWRHEITLEKTFARDPGQDYPVCVAFRGDSPVEYRSEDDPAEPEPFDLAGVNRKLAALTEQGSPS